MSPTQIEFKRQISKHLQELCRQRGLLKGNLLQSDDFDQVWRRLAPEFLADAVKEFNAYPEVVLAWGAYFGAAVAFCWDKDWQEYAGKGYEFYRGEGGFDYMDEHITADILGFPLGGESARSLADTFRILAGSAYSYLLHSGIEAGSVDAYQSVISAVEAMFVIGASVELDLLGYKWSKA